MPYSYATNVDPYCGDAVVVTVSSQKIEAIREFITRFTEAKKDPGSRAKRFYTGCLGEAALEVLLGVEFMDSTVGPSRRYAVSDLKKVGLNCGIKTVTRENVWGNDSFPAIEKRSKHPEIINFKVSDDQIMICGVADVETLQTYRDEALIRDKRMLDRKIGFYGFHKLKKFKTLDELKEILDASVPDGIVLPELSGASGRRGC